MKSPRGYSQSLRAQSAEATGRHIVEAFLARLKRQWYDEITLARVAEDAGVTVQTVVRRFGDKEGLLGQAVRLMATQINACRATPPGDIETLVDHLLEDYEQTGDAVIRLLALEPRHPALKEVLDFGREQHRTWISGVLGFLVNAAARERALDALVIVTDVYTWKLLRRDMARSLAATATTLKSLVSATMAEFCKEEQ
jgi:AcrR family transcriptional regulator